jgi:hypothetical protein
MRLKPGMGGLLALYAATFAALGAAAIHAMTTGVPPWLFTRDPAAIHVSDPMFGALSNLGVILWAAAASVALLAATVLRDPADARLRAYLLSVGLLTAWLLLDDLYMLHERLLPDVLGVPQPLVYAVYALLVAAVWFRFRPEIAATSWRLLVLALACFAFSIASDQGPGSWHRWSWLAFIEDGAKLVGIASWLAYLGSTVAAALRARVTHRS